MVNKQAIGLMDLVQKVKQELMTRQPGDNLFFVEEVNLEIKFVVTGDVNGGFNFGVVTVGSDVSEQRVQKVTVKLTPILSKEELRRTLPLEEQRKITASSSESLLKGGPRVK